MEKKELREETDGSFSNFFIKFFNISVKKRCYSLCF